MIKLSSSFEKFLNGMKTLLQNCVETTPYRGAKYSIFKILNTCIWNNCQIF